jgi:hypothetical protein
MVFRVGDPTGRLASGKLDEGLSDCEIFIIVLSKASIDRPWVQTELDAATVRKLDGKVQKIIPIKIDDCGDLPPILGSLMWEDFSTKPYDIALKGVLNSVLAVETKPPLGEIPDFPPLVATRATRISTTATIFWIAMAVAVLLIASKLTINVSVPPLIGQVIAGVLLAGVVWKLFERVEAVLTDNTKLEIAVWLLRVNVGQRVEPWPETFAKLFDRVFGQNHLSWRCFWRSSVASLLTSLIAVATAFLLEPERGILSSNQRAPTLTILLNALDNLSSWSLFVKFRGHESIGAVYRFGQGFYPMSVLDWFVIAFLAITTLFLTNLAPDYLSLLETRWLLKAFRSTKISSVAALLLLDLVLTAGLSVAWNGAYFILDTELWKVKGWLLMMRDIVIRNAFLGRDWFVIPSMFTSIWLWLYAGSGFLLKAARRFDIGFDWFNRKFDIEKKPLQSIGLVAGALVAVVYWIVLIVGHIVK